MIECEPLTKDHLQFFANGDAGVLATEGLISAEQIIEHWETYQSGPAFIGKDDGFVIAAAGVINLWPGVGEGWAVVLPRGNRRAVARRFREMFDLILIANNYHRIQASIQADFTAGIRFAEWLGFENEGVMRQFDSDRTDFVRMARIGP